MEMVRRGLFPVEVARGFALGGSPAGAVALPSSPPASAGHYTIDFKNFFGAGDVRVQTDEENFRRIIKVAERKNRRRS